MGELTGVYVASGVLVILGIPCANSLYFNRAGVATHRSQFCQCTVALILLAKNSSLLGRRRAKRMNNMAVTTSDSAWRKRGGRMKIASQKSTFV